MDMHIRMSNCSHWGFKTFASNYLGVNHCFFPQIEGLILEVFPQLREITLQERRISQSSSIKLRKLLIPPKGWELTCIETQEPTPLNEKKRSAQLTFHEYSWKRLLLEQSLPSQNKIKGLKKKARQWMIQAVGWLGLVCEEEGRRRFMQEWSIMFMYHPPDSEIRT